MGSQFGKEEAASAMARFPSRDDREAFLDQVRLWNGVQGLPRVHAQPLHDGARVQVRTVASAQRGITRLVEAFGGLIL